MSTAVKQNALREQQRRLGLSTVAVSSGTSVISRQNGASGRRASVLQHQMDTQIISSTSIIVSSECYFTTVYAYSCRGQSWRSDTKCDCKTDWLWVRSPLEEMKYLLKFIFPFPRSGLEAKRGVEFCHSTRKASRNQQKVGMECLNTRFPLPTLLCAGYSVKLILYSYNDDTNGNNLGNLAHKHHVQNAPDWNVEIAETMPITVLICR